MSGPITQGIAGKVREIVASWTATPSMSELEGLLRWLAKWRSQVLANTYIARHGTTVWSGLFAGMDYVAGATEGSLLARLLGIYEYGLQSHLTALAEDGLDCVVDVGCAEGYYAVGLARSFPGLSVYAHDIEEKARLACAELARRNGVADRVIIGGEFKPTDFQAFEDRRVLVMVDAEGAELEILQPTLSPALARMNIIVETHDVWRPGALAEMMRRFEPTHDIVRIDSELSPAKLPDWLTELSELDQMIARWEWRHRPTPWLVMKPKPSSHPTASRLKSGPLT